MGSASVGRRGEDGRPSTGRSGDEGRPSVGLRGEDGSEPGGLSGDDLAGATRRNVDCLRVVGKGLEEDGLSSGDGDGLGSSGMVDIACFGMGATSCG